MIDLLKVDDLNEAINKLYEECKKNNFCSAFEMIDIDECLGRITYEDIISNISVPGFNRSVVDGYAVIASDTNAASESVPVILKQIGESFMGEECTISIKSGECVYVPTGGMIPSGADACVMIENTEKVNDENIVIYSSVGSGKNIICAEDDIKKGNVIIKKGKVLSAFDIGLLSSADIKEIKVFKKPNITIISTGDELVSNKGALTKGKIKDINTSVIRNLSINNGFNVIDCILIKDDEEDLEHTISKYLDKSDFIIISGGSSKGKKDATSKIIDKISSTGVLTHGIAIKPGKPTITGFDHKTNTAIIGLPGHPVASAVLFDLLVISIYEKLNYVTKKEYTCTGTMSENLPASPGRLTLQLVNIDNDFNVYPILGKSGLIHTLSKADGYILIDKDDEGINKGDKVTVFYL